MASQRPSVDRSSASHSCWAWLVAYLNAAGVLLCGMEEKPVGVKTVFQVVCCERGICSHYTSKTTAPVILSLRSIDATVHEDHDEIAMDIGELRILSIEG